MKKYIFTIAAIACLSGTGAMAQGTEAQQELKAYMNDGLVSFESPNKKYSFRVGGRVMIDGAHYFDQYTDRSSGVRFGEARIRMFSTIGNNLDFKFDVDLAPRDGVVLKDVYLRWHTNEFGFLRLGNFAEPFSPENIQSNYDDHFINKTATIEALGTGRALGVSYRYYHPSFWGEAGFFSQKYNTLGTNGDMGWGFATRLLGRYTSDDLNFHIGGSFNYRRPNANGFTNGSDDYNRYVFVGSSLESSVDKTDFIGATINNVKNTIKYGAELMVNYRMVYLTGEYIFAKHNRERDWDYNYASIQGTLMATIFGTLEDYKKALGGDWAVHNQGATVQAGVLLKGGDYRYSRVDALMARPGAKSLELVLRYNYTDLNHVAKGSIFYNGNFFSSSTWQDFGITNGSVAGGRVSSYTIGLNYYVTNNLSVKLNYGYQHLDRRYSYTYQLDRDLHSIQGRVAFEF